jgi:hypothetical protein
MSIFAELKRRNVFRMGGGYLRLAVTQVTATVAPCRECRVDAQAGGSLGIIGFLLILAFAWVYG